MHYAQLQSKLRFAQCPLELAKPTQLSRSDHVSHDDGISRTCSGTSSIRLARIPLSAPAERSRCPTPVEAVRYRNALARCDVPSSTPRLKRRSSPGLTRPTLTAEAAFPRRRPSVSVAVSL